MANRYKIKGKIGRGGMGEIYRAYDNTLKRDVAIKRLLPVEDTHLNEAAVHSLDREVAALSRLQHPNVVNLFAFEKDEDGPYVVMEYIEGNTLKDVVSHGAVSLADFISIANQSLDPLVTAQELSLLHRDIKPDNIMLQWLSSGSFQVKVLDFGLAKFSQTPSLQTLDQTGAFLGSIDYLAPEQLDRQPLDARTDLYSLGCVLYYCLAQQPPFEGDTPAATMSNHLNHSVTHISEVRQDVPQAIAEWIMSLIARQPDQRPKDARDALQIFKSAQEGKLPEKNTTNSNASPASIEVAPLTATAVPVAIGPPTEASPHVGSSPISSKVIHTTPAEISAPVLPPSKKTNTSDALHTRLIQTRSSTPQLIPRKNVSKTKKITQPYKNSPPRHLQIIDAIQSPMAWIVAVLSILIVFLATNL